jgi:hypothetical protein
MHVLRAAAIVAAAWLACGSLASAQAVSVRGFVQGQAVAFPEDAPNDPANAVGDLLARADVFASPTSWLQLAAGADVRANSHDQVESAWRLDFSDRRSRRPALSIRRLSATMHHRGVTVDAGKQFIRWGKTDIVTPTDHFAPRDFLNVVDNDFLAVTGVRATVQVRGETFEAVLVPRFTPSRIPLLNQRWAPVPGDAASVRLIAGGARFPDGVQSGIRWSHLGSGYEYSLSYFDGFNHLPNIEVQAADAPGALVLRRAYPAIKSYGADAAVPTRWFTIKAESAYFTSTSPASDEYVLYVVQVERQTGEWLLIAGYAGEVVTERRAPLTFAPDRGLARSIVARVSYTIDSNRSVAIESAVRQNGRGAYAKAEYSHGYGQHWRATAAAAAIAGDAEDFLGQYRRNSHVGLTLRYSF